MCRGFLVTPLNNLNEQYHDAVWCNLFDGVTNVRLGCIYRSPSAQESTSLLLN